MTVTGLIAALQALEPEHGGKTVMVDGDGWLYDCETAYLGTNQNSHDPVRKDIVILGD